MIQKANFPLKKTSMKDLEHLQLSFQERYTQRDLPNMWSEKLFGLEWTARHEVAFTAAVKLLLTVHELAFYDPKRPTSLHVDTSRRNGLGFLFKQLDDSNAWHVMQAGSCFIFSSKTR